MASNPIRRKWTFEEYVQHEQDTGIKHEFINGEIYAMTGGTHKHSLIIANAITEIGLQLRGSDCRITSGDLRVQIDEDTYIYPDFLVICGNGDFTDDGEVTLKDPKLVAEVVSESSQKYDTGLKSEYYRSLDSVEYYLIIHQKRMLVQVFSRDGDAWRYKDYKLEQEDIPLKAINVDLPLSEIYRSVNFESDEE